MKIDVVELLKSSWETVKSAWAFYIVATLIATVLSSCTAGLLAGPFMVGLFMAIMKKMTGAQVSSTDVISMGLEKLVPALVAGLVGAALAYVGYFLLVIPGVLVSMVVSLAFMIIADEDKDTVSGKEALRQAFALFCANWLDVVVGSLVAGVIVAIGCGVCAIGELVTTPIAMVLLVKLYAAIKYNQPQAAAEAADNPSAN